MLNEIQDAVCSGQSLSAQSPKLIASAPHDTAVLMASLGLKATAQPTSEMAWTQAGRKGSAPLTTSESSVSKLAVAS